LRSRKADLVAIARHLHLMKRGHARSQARGAPIRHAWAAEPPRDSGDHRSIASGASDHVGRMVAAAKVLVRIF